MTRRNIKNKPINILTDSENTPETCRHKVDRTMV